MPELDFNNIAIPAELEEVMDLADTYECTDCNNTHPVDDEERYNDNGDRICEACDENYSTCEDCRDIICNDNLINVYNRQGSEVAVCNSCRHHNYFCCNSCEEIYPDTANEGHGYCGNCTDCYNDDDELSSNLIRDYNYIPRAYKFYPRANLCTTKPAKGVCYLGVELEVNTHDNDDAEYTIDALGEEHVYLKHDSSIGGGFEIVTHPHAMQAHRQLWPRFFAAVPPTMTSYRSGHCGMHVHISKSALTTMQIRRMLVFLNAPENYEYVKTIAQRTSGQYASIEKKELCQRLSTDRYEALNVTGRHTVEVRIFRGSVRQDRFFKNLEFCDALVQFTREHNYADLTQAVFIAWVTKHASSYKYLHNYHIEKGLQTGKPLAHTHTTQGKLPSAIDDNAS